MSARATGFVRPKRHFAGKPVGKEVEDEDDDNEQGVEEKNGEQKSRSERLRLEPITLKSDDIKRELDDHHRHHDDYEDYEIEEEGVNEEELKRLGIVIEEYGEGEELKLSEKDIKHVREQAVPGLKYEPVFKKEEPHESTVGNQHEGGGKEEDSESSAESESDSDSENVPLARPMFIKKTVKSEKAPAPTVNEDKADRTLNLIQQAVRREQAEERVKYEADGRDLEALDDTDDLDPEAEFQSWRLRELGRLRRERQMYLDEEKEQQELERRRALTEEEIITEDREKLEQQKHEKQSRPKGGFMQRHHHRGAFYQEDEILKRNFSEATEDDYKDKAALPKIMQVREGLGLKGRTRHRTLREEDTTLQEEDSILRKKRKN
jgi:microfibrillar-associated protein 1